MSEILEQVSLRYTGGNSDKVYNIQLVENEEGTYEVRYQYGRYGSTLKAGTKTSTPVAHEAARKEYDKILKEKTKEGYKVTGGGTVEYQNPDIGKKSSGLLPQLLNPIEEKDLETYIVDDDWIMQEKEDGERRIIRKIGNEVEGSNRDGDIVALPEAFVEDFRKFLGDITIDGEDMGGKYAAFDLLSLAGEDQRNRTVIERVDKLRSVFSNYSSSSLRLTLTAENEKEKRALLQQLRERRAEGVCFKLKKSKYISGRPNSGGDCVKFKFWESGTFKVTSRNGNKRSVFLEVKDGRPIGKVTIPANYAIPEEGVLVEVKYLYAYPNGSLYQPIYKGPRGDKKVADSYESLKFKAGSEENVA